MAKWIFWTVELELFDSKLIAHKHTDTHMDGWVYSVNTIQSKRLAWNSNQFPLKHFKSKFGPTNCRNIYSFESVGRITKIAYKASGDTLACSHSEGSDSNKHSFSEWTLPVGDSSSLKFQNPTKRNEKLQRVAISNILESLWFYGLLQLWCATEERVGYTPHAYTVYIYLYCVFFGANVHRHGSYQYL